MNTFLLDISLPLIESFQLKNAGNIEGFIRRLTELWYICRENRLFVSSGMSFSAPDLFKKTNDLIFSLFGILEEINSEQTVLSQHEFQVFYHCISRPLDEYCSLLLSMVNETSFNEKLMRISPDFCAEYTTMKESVLEGTTDLAAAEVSLLYWQGAVSDTIMQEAILQLRYRYLRKLSRQN